LRTEAARGARVPLAADTGVKDAAGETEQPLGRGRTDVAKRTVQSNVAGLHAKARTLPEVSAGAKNARKGSAVCATEPRFRSRNRAGAAEPDLARHGRCAEGGKLTGRSGVSSSTRAARRALSGVGVCSCRSSVCSAVADAGRRARIRRGPAISVVTSGGAPGKSDQRRERPGQPAAHPPVHNTVNASPPWSSSAARDVATQGCAERCERIATLRAPVP
jgi:hypothetical protein